MDIAYIMSFGIVFLEYKFNIKINLFQISACIYQYLLHFQTILNINN